MPLSVPKAMPIFRCRVGVTNRCSATRISVKSPSPSHSQPFWGQNDPNQKSAATLTACNKILNRSDTRAEKRAGME